MTLAIPKEEVLNLIKKDSCSFYDRNNYVDVNVEVVLDSYTRFVDDKLLLTFKDLSSLLFDRVVVVNSELTIVVP